MAVALRKELFAAEPLFCDPQPHLQEIGKSLAFCNIWQRKEAPAAPGAESHPLPKSVRAQLLLWHLSPTPFSFKKTR